MLRHDLLIDALLVFRVRGIRDFPRAAAITVGDLLFPDLVDWPPVSPSTGQSSGSDLDPSSASDGPGTEVISKCGF